MHAPLPDDSSPLDCVYPQLRNKHSRKKQTIGSPCASLLVLACLGVTGCGGGGGEASSATPATAVSAPAPAASVTPAPPPATAALATYAGTWYGPCSGRIQDTATVGLAPASANVLVLKLVRNFHAADGCASTALASETLSSDFSLTYGSTTNASAILAPGRAVTQVTLDLVTIAIPAYTRTRSGAAVTTSTVNGVLNWCIAYTDGPVCTADPGLQPAASAPGAIYLDNGELVLLSPSNGGYVADSRYTKVRTTTQDQGPAFQRTDLLEGTGALATSGRTLTVNYTGWLYDPAKPNFKGAQFDTSVGKAPFTFRLGAGQVIAGWDQGLLGMRAGGRRMLIIPAAMAYGRTGSGTSIPPDAPLLFEVELISVQ